MLKAVSSYFELVEVADGVYAAIVLPGTGAVGNAGFVDIGGKTVIFDTFQSFQAAKELRKLAEERTGNQEYIVINSHYHLDHVLGNQAFADSVIMSTEKTRELLPIRAARFFEMVRKHTGHVVHLREEAKKEKDLGRKQELLYEIGDAEHIDEYVNEYEIVSPQLVFQKHITIHGTKRSVEVIQFGNGHSEDDSILYVPDEKIAFTGDLAFNRSHPNLKFGNPEEWVRLLDQLLSMDITVYVPGHGGVASRQHVEEAKRYIVDLLSFVANKGTAQKIPIIYQEWDYPSLYDANVQFLMNRSE